ncbi:MAG: hypothetical protein BZY83_06210 [SAR202 cluster bacterium Casp-Chloro-G2]|nr:MAG: hypothetical protein BZY83_06210 [SAR202 cluster bacterium Casp-Chloro-G2]
MALTAKQLRALDPWPESLVTAINSGTASADGVEEYLREVSALPGLQSPLLGFLSAQKSRLLLRDGQAEEAFAHAEQALAHDNGSPANWLVKGEALSSLERYDEASDSFESAFSTRKRHGSKAKDYLPMILKSWSGCALLQGLSGIINQDLNIAQNGVHEYLRVLGEAKSEGLEDAVMVPLSAASKTTAPPELNAALDELALMVKLLSIKDPFEGWREFSKEISKVWPKGLSAVNAIREQRE